MITAIIFLTLAIVVIAALDSRPAPEERARLAAQPSTPVGAGRFIAGIAIVIVILVAVTL